MSHHCLMADLVVNPGEPLDKDLGLGALDDLAVDGELGDDGLGAEPNGELDAKGVLLAGDLERLAIVEVGIGVDEVHDVASVGAVRVDGVGPADVIVEGDLQVRDSHEGGAVHVNAARFADKLGLVPPEEYEVGEVGVLVELGLAVRAARVRVDGPAVRAQDVAHLLRNIQEAAKEGCTMKRVNNEDFV